MLIKIMNNQEYYKRQRVREERIIKAHYKANHRGEVAKQLFDSGFKLTRETQPWFNQMMKDADKQWENDNK